MKILDWFFKIEFTNLTENILHDPIADDENPDCGNFCGWVQPFGFVPEAGCPIHDRPEYAPFQYKKDPRIVEISNFGDDV